MKLKLENSDVEWRDKVQDMQIDFEKTWKSSFYLKEAPVGNTSIERQIDSLTGTRENIYEILQIVPIRNVKELTDGQKQELVVRKTHMFISEIWKLAQGYISNTNSFGNFSCGKIAGSIRKKIELALPDDNDSRKIYLDSLNNGSGAFISIADELATNVITSLDEVNLDAARMEALKAYKNGPLLEILGDDAELEEILHCYVSSMMEQIIGFEELEKVIYE